jgi:hypothetical protein
MIRPALLAALAVVIAGCGSLAPPMTEAQREAQRQREWEERYDRKAQEDLCGQVRDSIDRRTCNDRVDENNRTMREFLPLRFAG